MTPKIHQEAFLSEPSITRKPLREHQTGDIAWWSATGRGLLANEPGLGKSRSAIEGAAGLGDVLIIAPGMVIDSGVWDDELAAWADPGTQYWVAPYSMLNARKDGKPILALRPDLKRNWGAVIVDEAHYVKGRNTYWTWATHELARRTDRFLAMTGTPIPNWSHELFTVLRMLWIGESQRGQRFGSFWRWAETWFDCSPSRFSRGLPVAGELLGCTKTCATRAADDPCAHYRRFAEENLGGRWRRMLRAECLDLPPLSVQDVLTPMAPAQARIYRQMAQHFTTTVSGKEVLSWSHGAKQTAIDRITTSPWLLNPEGRVRGGKLEQLRFDLEGRSRPTLVFAHYQDSVDACSRVAASLGARTATVHGGLSASANRSAVSRFKAGELDVLCASISMLSVGATLTQADMMIMVERSWSQERNEQALYRVHRMGQLRPVTVRRYVTPNSVDARKEKVLKGKSDRAIRMMTAAEFARLL